MHHLTKAFFVSLAILLIGACTTLPQPTAEDQVRAALSAFHAAEISGDMDTILNTYSEDFLDPQGVDKAGVHGFFQAVISQGLLRNLKVDMDATRVEFDKGVAYVAPVNYSSALGPSSFEYQLRLEADGVWRFISSKQI